MGLTLVILVEVMALRARRVFVLLRHARCVILLLTLLLLALFLLLLLFGLIGHDRFSIMLVVLPRAAASSARRLFHSQRIYGAAMGVPALEITSELAGTQSTPREEAAFCTHTWVTAGISPMRVRAGCRVYKNAL